MEVLLPFRLPNFSQGRVVVVLTPILWVFARAFVLLLATVLLVVSYLAVVCNRPTPFKEHNNACDVIDRVFLPFPGRNWLFDNGATSTLKIISVPERHDQVDNFFTREKFPDTIGGQYLKFIFIRGMELKNFWTKRYKNRHQVLDSKTSNLKTYLVVRLHRLSEHRRRQLNDS